MQDISYDIIRKCQDGSAEAFAVIVAAFEKPLYSFVRRILRNAPPACEPEDAVQETFLKAYRGIGSYRLDGVCKFSTWLFAIAHNHCMTLLRKKSLDMEVSDSEEEPFAAVPDTRSPNPREAAADKEMAGRVAEAVSHLPEEIRSAFILRFYQDMAYEEIAEVVRCPVGTVKSRLARARERLSQELVEFL